MTWTGRHLPASFRSLKSAIYRPIPPRRNPSTHPKGSSSGCVTVSSSTTPVQRAIAARGGLPYSHLSKPAVLSSGGANGTDKLMTHYPLLPLRDIVVFPGMVVPLFVGREKSVACAGSRDGG